MQRIPGVQYAAAPRAESSAAPLAWPPRLIVVHDTGNPTSTKEQEAAYAHTRGLEGATSAHAYIDNGGVLGSLRLDRQAWAAYGYANRNGIHLEMCLRGDRAATRAITARLVAQLCDLAGIPKVKLTPSQVAAGARGVCGHLDITRGLGVGDHTDPGVGFPWAEFMAQVSGSVPAKTGEDMDLNDSSPWTTQYTTEPGVTEGPWLGGKMGQQLQYLREDTHFTRALARRAALELAGLRAIIESLAAVITRGGGDVDTAVILEALDARLDALAKEQRDAVADLGEGGSAQVRADA